MTGSKGKYRNHLPLPEDTTIGGGEALLTPGFLRFVGELVFGERWQTPLACRLGKVRGKALSPATIHRWTTERRSIPAWVADALALILEHSRQDLDRRARIARAVARRIREPHVRDASPAMEVIDSERRRRRQDSLRGLQ